MRSHLSFWLKTVKSGILGPTQPVPSPLTIQTQAANSLGSLEQSPILISDRDSRTPAPSPEARSYSVKDFARLIFDGEIIDRGKGEERDQQAQELGLEELDLEIAEKPLEEEPEPEQEQDKELDLVDVQEDMERMVSAYRENYESYEGCSTASSPLSRQPSLTHEPSIPLPPQLPEPTQTILQPSQASELRSDKWAGTEFGPYHQFTSTKSTTTNSCADYYQHHSNGYEGSSFVAWTDIGDRSKTSNVDTHVPVPSPRYTPWLSALVGGGVAKKLTNNNMIPMGEAAPLLWMAGAAVGFVIGSYLHNNQPSHSGKSHDTAKLKLQ